MPAASSTRTPGPWLPATTADGLEELSVAEIASIGLGVARHLRSQGFRRSADYQTELVRRLLVKHRQLLDLTDGRRCERCGEPITNPRRRRWCTDRCRNAAAAAARRRRVIVASSPGAS